jgi:hypothetical protein
MTDTASLAEERARLQGQLDELDARLAQTQAGQLAEAAKGHLTEAKRLLAEAGKADRAVQRKAAETRRAEEQAKRMRLLERLQQLQGAYREAVCQALSTLQTQGHKLKPFELALLAGDSDSRISASTWSRVEEPYRGRIASLRRQLGDAQQELAAL